MNFAVFDNRSPNALVSPCSNLGLWPFSQSLTLDFSTTIFPQSLHK